MPSPTVVTIGFRCPPDLYRDITKQAKLSNVSLSRWLRDAARDQVKVQRDEIADAG